MTREITAEVISIGDEITCGKLLDTNSQWISQRLNELGVGVRFHSTIGDRLDDYAMVLSAACDRSDLVICSGGMGPTEDDLTSPALAKLAGVDLEFDETSWRNIESIFARRNRPLVASNRKQAMLPRGSRAIFNPNGTAPGIDLTLRRANRRAVRIFAFPGVPAELREMWPSIVPLIRQLVGDRVVFHYSLHCFGAGESEIESMIPPEIMQRGRDPLVGITASQAVISLRVSTSGESLEECERFAQPTIDRLRQSVGNLCFGQQSDTLESVVLDRLKQRGLTLAIVDGGLFGQLYLSLRQLDPQGECVRAGLQLSELSRRLLFPATDRESGGEGLEQLAIAEQARRMFQTDLAIAVGVLPGGDERLQTFWTAVTAGQKSWVREFSCAAHPAIRTTRAARQVLNLLRQEVFQ